MPSKTPTIADVDPALADALRVWRAWLKSRSEEPSEAEKQLEGAIRALERDPASGQRRRVLFALRDARNDREAAAAALGISTRTLLRWMQDLDLWDLADRQAEIHGWPVRPHPERISPEKSGTSRRAGKP